MPVLYLTHSPLQAFPFHPSETLTAWTTIEGLFDLVLESPERLWADFADKVPLILLGVLQANMPGYKELLMNMRSYCVLMALEEWIIPDILLGHDDRKGLIWKGKHYICSCYRHDLICFNYCSKASLMSMTGLRQRLQMLEVPSWIELWCCFKL